ncbi:hypothetical protein BZL30_4446 [Mycobacterium kansasii]|uniref:Uncharacterized protein n=1 Tax=Mycobacterium kansasii TaxID=1768 RepID=A0A1V3X2S9_MYCKA|nr:hypothetical protein BZL30_4446 [Mycobacterium kansasii]
MDNQSNFKTYSVNFSMAASPLDQQLFRDDPRLLPICRHHSVRSAEGY